MSTSDLLQFNPESTLTFDKGSASVEGPTSTTLRLTNSSHTLDILFRVQTTSPTVYRVRPSHGRIPANTHLDVQVVMVTEPVKVDKFLVKWVTISHTLPSSGDFLRQFQEAEGSTQERRLRVNIINATSDEHSKEESGGAAEHSASSVSINGILNTSSTPLPDISALSSDELAMELKEARIRIQSLTSRNRELAVALEEAKGLRKRLTSTSSSSPPSGAAEERENVERASTQLPRGITEAELDALLKAQAGFPPILVILIALFAFLIGLMF